MKLLSSFVLSLVTAGSGALAAQEALAQDGIVALELGRPIAREIGGGITHDYRVDLESGEFMLVVADQYGVDLAVTVIGPDGEAIREFDGPAMGPERAPLVAEASGTYGITVRPFDPEAERGRYTITLERREAAATTPSGKVDQLFAPWDRPGSPGAAVAVVKDGDVVYRRGFGSANLEHDIPITPSTVFDIASVSKQFAGLAIAMLVDQGKVSLDDDIREYLPDMPDFGKRITVRHLVHHTSGLRDWTSVFPIAGTGFEDVIAFDQILNMARYQKELNYDPGAEYSYTNTGYNLLAEIVERVTGAPFPDWMEAEVFEPLGMTSTHFHGDHDRIVVNRAYSYATDPERRYRNVANNLTALGSSSLYTTVEDLAKWALNYEDARVGGRAAIELTHERGILNDGDTIGYAFGQGVGEYRGLRTVAHGGSWAGFRTYLLRLPEQRAAVIVLSNLAGFPTTFMARSVADVYLADQMSGSPSRLGRRPIEREEVAVDAEILEDHVGTYRLGRGWLLTITREGNRLMAQATAEDKFGMTALSDSTFWVYAYGAAVVFRRDSEGEVSQIAYRGIQAPRVEPLALSPEQLGEYAGVYFSEELETSYTVVIEDAQLVARHWRNEDVPLYPTAKDEFRGPVWWLRLVTFDRDSDGRVVGVRVTNGRVRNLRFEKRM
jgi:CubicO group peptidase (beta-lactamase class C family)